MNNRWKFKPVKLSGIVWTLLLLTFCLAGLLIWTVLYFPRPLPGLSREVAESLALSGVDNSVTAVLLNFRGYDTMLEVTVLLLGVITVWSITHAPFPAKVPDTSPIQAAAVRLLIPFICLIGGYLIWQGAYQTGGAFQGGAVLSSALVLLLISDFFWIPHLPSLPLRLVMTMGPLVFVLMAVWGIVAGGALLEFSPQRAGTFLLFLEVACAISIGLTLAAFFAGGRPPADLREEMYRSDQDTGEG